MSDRLTWDERRSVVKLATAYAELLPEEEVASHPAVVDGMDLFWRGYGIEQAVDLLPWRDDPNRAQCLEDVAWRRSERVRERRGRQ